MPIGTSDGDHFESDMHQQLDLPTVFDDAENKEKHLSSGGRGPLKITITPHMDAGEGDDSERRARQREEYEGIQERRERNDNPDFRNRDRFAPFLNKDNDQVPSLQGPAWKMNTITKLDEPKEVHIVRHGETTANDDNTVRGTKMPIPLNENGRAEAEKAADKLKEAGVDTIVASPLERSKETAEIIGKKLGITPQYDPRLATWDVGEHEGKPCETSNPVLEDYAKNKQDEPVPGGESFNDFTNRSFAGIRDAILNNKDKNLAIITHNRVEATLKGWEKTGQDNPDIDYKEAVKEETEPGVVRKTTFEPDATILQPGPAVGTQVAENFNERYGEWGILNPGTRNEVYSHPGMFQKIPDAGKPFENIPGGEGLGTQPLKKQINPIMKHIRQSLVDHIMGASDQLVSDLHDILIHPENLVGTHELGMIRPPGFNLGELLKAGKSLNKIAEEHNIPYKTLQQQAKREGLESQHSQFAKTSDSDLDVRVQKGLDEDKSYSEIAKELGISRNAVAGRVNRMKMENPSQQQQGKAPETIKAAALRHPKTGEVHEGISHGDALNAAHDSRQYPGRTAYDIPWEEGFTTSTGRYVDRAEAVQIRDAETGTEYGHKKLISEDVPALRKVKRERKPLNKEEMNDLIKAWHDILDNQDTRIRDSKGFLTSYGRRVEDTK